MRVGITTFGGDGGKSGIGQYIIQLLKQFSIAERAFAGSPQAVTFEVLVHDDEQEVFAPSSLGMSTRWISPKFRPAPQSLLWHQTVLPVLCQQRGYDVLFLPAGNRRLPFSCPCPTVGSVFDFSILHVPGKYDALHETYITRVLPVLARRLTRVITLSENAKRDITGFVRVPSDRVHVIPAGVDTALYRARPRHEAHQRVAKRFEDKGMRANAPYLLYISRIEHPGKNHVRLIDAFNRLKAAGDIPHQLVLAGSDWLGAEAVHHAVRQSPFCADIVLTGFVPASVLPDLYCGADLFVFPSLYEGFGLPILEAMASETPVACANTSSLPEVAGNAAALFAPTCPDSIAETVGTLLQKPALRRDLVCRGREQVKNFSWKTAACQTLDVLRDAAEGKSGQ